MLRHAYEPNVSTRVTRAPSQRAAAGCKVCRSQSASATLAGHVNVNGASSGTSAETIVTALCRRHPSDISRSGSARKCIGVRASVARQSSGSRSRRASLKRVRKFGAASISSGAQGLKRGGISIWPVRKSQTAAATATMSETRATSDARTPPLYGARDECACAVEACSAGGAAKRREVDFLHLENFLHDRGGRRRISHQLRQVGGRDLP